MGVQPPAPMNSVTQATIAHLRKAAAEAIAAGNDEAAETIMRLIREMKPVETFQPSLIAQTPVKPQQATAPVEKVAPGPPIGPARFSAFWVAVIERRYIPFLRDGGKSEFTTQDIFAWVEYDSGMQLTTGDLKEKGGQSRAPRPSWRVHLGDALIKCKCAGLLAAEPKSKTYRILSAA